MLPKPHIYIVRKAVIDMAYTLSFHKEGQNLVKQKHNRRDPKAVSKQDHIYHELSKNNVYLVDIPIRQAYKKLFGDSVKEYNARTRESRKIDNYYKKIHNDAKQQTAYEIIVQLGSKEEGTPEQAVNALIMYADDWERRNPNMKLIGAYIHDDEETTHMHLDFIPYAECNRGMKIQNSLTKALAAQGFCHSNKYDKHKTPLIQWEQSERNFMREICNNLNIDLKAQGKGRSKHYSSKEYKTYKEDLNQIKVAIALEQGYLLETKCEVDRMVKYGRNYNQKLSEGFESNEEQGIHDKFVGEYLREHDSDLYYDIEMSVGLVHPDDIDFSEEYKEPKLDHDYIER